MSVVYFDKINTRPATETISPSLVCLLKSMSAFAYCFLSCTVLRREAAPGLPADGVQSLASRNLMRHVNFGMPSGQAVARRIGAPILTPMQLDMLKPFDMEKSTPLWFYILKEVELMENGLRLGPVGARIVGEVFIGLLKADESSYLAARPNWTPVLPSAAPGEFHMTDLLTFAGVVPPLD